MLLLKTLSLIISAEFLLPQKVTFMVSGNQNLAISAGILQPIMPGKGQAQHLKEQHSPRI